MSDGTAAMSDATSGERVRNQQRRRPPQHLQRNSGPSTVKRLTAQFDDLRIAYAAGAKQMSDTTDGKNRRKRKRHVTAESRGKKLVMAELLRRGFHAELADASSEKHDILVRVRDAPPTPIRIKTVHSPPWYVRRASFNKRSDQVTVYVLLAAETSRMPTRFFVVKNSDLAAHFRQPSTWRALGLIDVKSVEKYEDNWDVLS